MYSVWHGLYSICVNVLIYNIDIDICIKNDIVHN